MSEIKILETQEEVRKEWLTHKVLNLDFRGIKDRTKVAEYVGLPSKNTPSLYMGGFDGKHHETFCLICDTKENAEECDGNYAYKLSEILEEIKKLQGDAYLYFGYNEWEDKDRSDSEEEFTGQICLVKKEGS